MASFRVPRLQAGLGIVDAKGRPVTSFMRWWNMEVAPSIESQFADISDLIAQIQQVQVTQAEQLELINDALELAGLALETADGGSPTKSGSATGTFPLSSTLFAPAVTVPLLGVAAGDLTIPGTGPKVTPSGTTMSGGLVTNAEYRIVEVQGGVDLATVFTGTFTITDVTGDEPTQIFQVNHTSANAVSSFSLPRTTTGDLEYRVDVRRVSGAVMSGVRFYLFARRAA